MYRVRKFNPSEPLLRFSRKLGRQAPNWAIHERLMELSCPDFEIDTRTALNITLMDLLRLVVTYGEALSMTFLMGDDVVALDVNSQMNEQDLRNFREAISDSPTLSLQLIIDKQLLAEKWFGELFGRCSFPNRLILYLFPERVAEFLCKSNLTQLEELLWKDHLQERIVLLIPGTDCYLFGGHLLVIGGESLRVLPTEVFEDHRISKKRLDRVHQQCQDALKWQTQMSPFLTPWHLYLSKQSGQDEVAGALRSQFTNLLLMYTADRTVMQLDGEGNRQYQASYSSPQQTVEVPLITGDCKEIGSLPQDNFDNMLHLFEWAYDPQWTPTDRLVILQVTVVDALRGSDIKQRHRLLIENAPSILENTQWHWKAFAKQRVEQYWEQINELENYLGETVKVYSERVNEMASRLTETVLAAVGVLLGSFVAALFQGEFNAVIFRIGLLSYALYVLFFPLLYGMKNQWEGYQMARREFEIRRKKFQRRLPAKRALEISKESTVDENSTRFERWFKYSVIVYVVMIFVATTAAIFVPDLVTSSTAGL